jgi:predicted metal-binding membrane protein
VGGVELAADGITVAIVLGAAVAWAVTAWQMPGSGIAMGLGSVASFATIWTVMMAAMMLPSAIPLVYRFARQAEGRRKRPVAVGMLGLVYLAVWLAFGVACYLAYNALGMPRRNHALAGGVALGLAALYALTPLKRISQDRCREVSALHGPLPFSLVRAGAVAGSCSRCRARTRHPDEPSSPRAAAGRSASSATSNSTRTRRPGAVPSVTACTIIPRTAVRTALTRRADLAGTAPGPASTTAPGSASMPDAAGPACASHVMNSPSCSAPACQSFPVRAHHRRNSAIAPAYALVVDSAPSRPNRRCRKNASANGTTASSLSSTVQYPAPDGNLTMNARTVIPRSS